MPTTGQFIRERLVEAAKKGVVIADLHKERRANWRELGLVYKTGTYQSFCRLFFFLEQLKWVERTDKTEASHAKGGITELIAPRIYYRITDEGLAHGIIDWTDPLSAKYPELTGSARATKYRLPSGRPRGRPRLGPPVVKRPPKPRVVKPPKVKIPEIILTEEDKKKLIDDFIEVMEREPTKAEIYELFLEEVKIRQRKVKEELE